MNYAYLIMGKYDAKKDRAEIGNGKAQLIGVSSVDEACEVAKEILGNGVDCVELCGAFGPNGAKKVVEATGNKFPIGYITHLAEQDELYKEIFSKR